MVNGRLVTIKTKGIIYDEKYINSLHRSLGKSRWRPSYLSGMDLMLENTMLRKIKISNVAKMVTMYIMKYGFLMRYDLNTRLPEQINYMKLKHAD